MTQSINKMPSQNNQDLQLNKVPYGGVGALHQAKADAEESLKDLQNWKIESYEEAFTKIMSATGINDLELLIRTFITTEEKNFALFKFVNEQN